MLTVLARWTMKEGFEHEVLQQLEKLTALTRTEVGNLRYEVFRSLEAPAVLLLQEEYTDAAAIEAHRSQPYFRTIVLEKVLPLLSSREVQVLATAAT
jgi:quinol monooxygenase YgiN